MVVRVRFGRGPLVTRRKGKNSRIAVLAASLLTLVGICLASFGVWRLCEDLGLASNFVFSAGLLSHWQVWIAAAVVVQYACWRLTRYARLARAVAAENPQKEGAPAKATEAVSSRAA